MKPEMDMSLGSRVHSDITGTPRGELVVFCVEILAFGVAFVPLEIGFPPNPNREMVGRLLTGTDALVFGCDF